MILTILYIIKHKNKREVNNIYKTPSTIHQQGIYTMPHLNRKPKLVNLEKPIKKGILCIYNNKGFCNKKDKICVSKGCKSYKIKTKD